jgi:hypothetical protein
LRKPGGERNIRDAGVLTDHERMSGERAPRWQDSNGKINL